VLEKERAPGLFTRVVRRGTEEVPLIFNLEKGEKNTQSGGDMWRTHMGGRWVPAPYETSTLRKAFLSFEGIVLTIPRFRKQ